MSTKSKWEKKTQKKGKIGDLVRCVTNSKITKKHEN